MKQLIEAGLIGAGRVNVQAPVMVGRYNEALALIGQEPTMLRSFTIDGVGWSPEVAEEKRNPLYLFQGEANRCAIVLSPDQAGKPIYFPYASYERALMAQYFGKYRREIADITTTNAMVLILDQEITRYDTPLDLPLDYVEVRTDTNGLVEEARAQKTLIAELTKGDQWTDPELRENLAAHARAKGDLRYRSIQITDLLFKDCGNFFTEAFGGVFVLKKKKEVVIILENLVRSGIQPGVVREGVVMSIADPALPKFLIDSGFADLDLGWYADHPEVLEEMRDCLVAILVTEANPDLPSYLGLSIPKVKALVSKIPPEKLRLLGALERLQRRFRKEQAGPVKGLERELELLLMRPFITSRLKNPRRDLRYETVSMVLSRLRSHDPLELYRADKNRFVQKYTTWPPAYQEWATARIKDRYEPVMNQPLAEKE